MQLHRNSNARLYKGISQILPVQRNHVLKSHRIGCTFSISSKAVDSRIFIEHGILYYAHILVIVPLNGLSPAICSFRKPDSYCRRLALNNHIVNLSPGYQTEIRLLCPYEKPYGSQIMLESEMIVICHSLIIIQRIVVFVSERLNLPVGIIVFEPVKSDTALKDLCHHHIGLKVEFIMKHYIYTVTVFIESVSFFIIKSIRCPFSGIIVRDIVRPGIPSYHP